LFLEAENWSHLLSAMKYFKAILEYESLTSLKVLEKNYKKPLERLANYVVANT
jgi:hypothetical protein